MHVRIVSPTPLTPDVVALVRSSPACTNVIVLPGAGVEPAGDVVLTDVAREATSPILEGLAALGVEIEGSVAVQEIDVSLSRGARRAEDAAPGLSEDAVVWEEVAERTGADAQLSAAFLVLMALATMIAMIGVLFDQSILVVGAMVVGPDFGPLAALSLGLVQRRFRLAGGALGTLLTGFGVGVVAAIAMALLLQAWGLASPDTLLAERPQTSFIWSPDALSWIVGFLAGVAGMVSLTTGRSGVLIGVLISVTTVPAAGNAAVALAYGVGEEARGSAVQLAINLSMIVVGGVLTLLLQRLWWARHGLPVPLVSHSTPPKA
jgi:uncharacterized hydrophobic protein (TIGR00271 family)